MREPAQQEAQQCDRRQCDQRVRFGSRRVRPGILAEREKQRGTQAAKRIAAAVDDDSPHEPARRRQR